MNMKKILVFVFALVLILTLAACGGDSAAGSAQPDETPAVSETPRESEALDTALSREEMAAILVGAAEANGETLGVLDGIESTIRDYETVSADKRAAVLACYSNGLITGIGNDHFGPQGTMNRAQMATVVCRLMNYIPRASV